MGFDIDAVEDRECRSPVHPFENVLLCMQRSATHNSLSNMLGKPVRFSQKLEEEKVLGLRHAAVEVGRKCRKVMGLVEKTVIGPPVRE
jgi:hypothetical protein